MKNYVTGLAMLVSIAIAPVAALGQSPCALTPSEAIVEWAGYVPTGTNLTCPKACKVWVKTCKGEATLAAKCLGSHVKQVVTLYVATCKAALPPDEAKVCAANFKNLGKVSAKAIKDDLDLAKSACAEPGVHAVCVGICSAP